MTDFDCIVIGGGASGLFYGALHDNIQKGLILDKGPCGLKLLLSGSGQCNITHDGSIKDFIEHYGPNGRRIRSILYSGNNLFLRNFLETCGIKTVAREDGKVFPASMKASEILNMLLNKCSENSFEIHKNEGVTDIAYKDGLYHVITDKQTYNTNRLVIACGGKSYPKTGSDGSIIPVIEKLGIRIVPQNPALAPVYVHSYPFRECAGISFRNIDISVLENNREIASVKDDILLTHRSFSGPGVLTLSRYAAPGYELLINYVSMDKKMIQEQIKNTFHKSRKELHTYISSLFSLTQNFTMALLNKSSLCPYLKASSLTGEEIEEISVLLSEDRYNISGVGGYNEAMVTCGGVSLDEINLKTMESVKYKGLYFIGEILDIDGDTGGYNLQFAFSSAKAALKKDV